MSLGRAGAFLPALALLGCAWRGTPVPVSGDLAGLGGEWEGMYSSVETGRSGTLSFKLDAATDSAFGDVWMGAAEQQDIRQHDAPRVAAERPHPGAALRIAFVRARRGRVTGRLEPYRDPVTGDQLLTVFEGVRDGDEFHGTYTTRNEVTGRIARGDWTAHRQTDRP